LRAKCAQALGSKKVRRIYPAQGSPKLIAVLDGLYGDGETIKSLKASGFSYIIVVKEGDHEALFEAVQAGKTEEFEYQDAQGVLHGFRYSTMACRSIRVTLISW
jgi:hypothetical protein